MRFGHVLLAYFVMGAVMWGGGALAWGDVPLGGFVIDDPSAGNISINENTSQGLEQVGGPIQQAARTVGGTGLLAVWNLLAAVIGMMFWPITALIVANAPPRVIVLFGGAPTIAFYGALFRVIRSSA